MKISTILIGLVIVLMTRTAIAQTLEWAKQIGGAQDERGHSIAVDGAGNVYTAGYFTGTVNFDPGTGIYSIPSAGSYDIFVSKLDASGNFVWAKRLGGTEFDKAYSIAVDVAGNVYITGLFEGTADFDPSDEIQNLTSVGRTDVFISKLDSDGNFVWVKQLGGNDFNHGYSITVDDFGYIYATGYFRGTVEFNIDTITSNLTSYGAENVFIAKLDTAGNYKWVKQLGGNFSSIGHSIAVDGSGNVYTTGIFTGTADFDPDSVKNYILTSGGDEDVFVSKLDSSGNFVWAKQLGGMSGAVSNSIAVDGAGNVYTTGYFYGTIDFDPGDGNFKLTTGGGSDIFISKLDASGNFVWAKQLGGMYDDRSLSITLDATGDVYTTGLFQYEADFDPSEETYVLSSESGNDVYISKLSSSGDFVWAVQLAGNSNLEGMSIAIDDFSNVYTTGYFIGTTDFDPGEGKFEITSIGKEDVFVHKMSQSTSAIVENFFSQKVYVYPNPASDLLHISLDTEFSNVQVTMRNIVGEELIRKHFANSQNIELSLQVQQGIYFLEIIANDRKAIMKVIKEGN